MAWDEANSVPAATVVVPGLHATDKTGIFFANQN